MQITIGNYYTGNSGLHRLDPRVKFLAALGMMILIFCLHTSAALLAYGVFLFVLCLSSRIPLCKLARSVRSVLFLAGLAFIFNLFSGSGIILWQFYGLKITDTGLSIAVIVAVRLFYLVITSTLLLTAVTTPLAVADAMEKLMNPLIRLGFPGHELALIMSIALRYVPTLVTETDKIMKAQAARGADFDTGGLWSRLRGMVTVLVPLFVSAFKRAADLAWAMEARCYSGGAGRTKLHPLRMKKADWLWTASFVVAAACMIALEIAWKKLM